jgi:squalene-hopene/tetraprenyl-beta-curcumene cyclase
MKKYFALLSLVFSGALFASPEIDTAIARGAEFILSQQKNDGHFSDAHMPALTALPLWALSGEMPIAVDQQNLKSARHAAAVFIIGTQREDGGFYVPKPGRGGSGLGNYNTAVCLSALFESGLAKIPVLLKAREYIASSQLTGDDTMAGGFGYDKLSRRRHADLSNTSYALDAMRRTASVEDFRSGKERVDLNWEKALAFVENLMKTEGPDKGGAAYNESTPQGGMTTNKANKVQLKAYGSMTYAAVLSMASAKLDRADPRVREALNFCQKYWTVDENPGMGNQGLYYFYDIMARALSASGVDKVGEHDWRSELAKKIISLQSPDGSWANENNRFWESDKVLCTSFALIALKECRKR